ncbi:hypothetical protein [Nocardioides sp. LML1-1-1.1]|uniref:hypothetical protein n=1 Tax=Nocardioides sp. LML1-1-1.1 TaxID=3135248 RepID=UPI00341B54CF
MLVSALPSRHLGVPVEKAVLRIGRTREDQPFAMRSLLLAGRPAFDLSLWCGTCPFLFERKEGATSSSPAETLPVLEGPLATVGDDVLDAFGALLPAGEFLPLLLEVRPRLVAPHDADDYFTHEQVATWGVDSFWGLPENPRSFYYRTFQTAVADDAHLYEFVVPMVPPGWNERARVHHYGELLAAGVTPTAVALSTLDVCEPATEEDGTTDVYAHWGLTHFLLDGHHKLEAAAASGASVRLLALVSIDGSLAAPDDVRRLPSLLGQPASARP